jgi:hypothetical protein
VADRKTSDELRGVFRSRPPVAAPFGEAHQRNCRSRMAAVTQHREAVAAAGARVISRLFECTSEPILRIGAIEDRDDPTQLGGGSHRIAIGQREARAEVGDVRIFSRAQLKRRQRDARPFEIADIEPRLGFVHAQHRSAGMTLRGVPQARGCRFGPIGEQQKPRQQEMRVRRIALLDQRAKHLLRLVLATEERVRPGHQRLQYWMVGLSREPSPCHLERLVQFSIGLEISDENLSDLNVVGNFRYQRPHALESSFPLCVRELDLGDQDVQLANPLG